MKKSVLHFISLIFIANQVVAQIIELGKKSSFADKDKLINYVPELDIRGYIKNLSDLKSGNILIISEKVKSLGLIEPGHITTNLNNYYLMEGAKYNLIEEENLFQASTITEANKLIGDLHENGSQVIFYLYEDIQNHDLVISEALIIQEVDSIISYTISQPFNSNTLEMSYPANADNHIDNININRGEGLPYSSQ